MGGLCRLFEWLLHHGDRVKRTCRLHVLNPPFRFVMALGPPVPCNIVDALLPR